MKNNEVKSKRRRNADGTGYKIKIIRFLKTIFFPATTILLQINAIKIKNLNFFFFFDNEVP